MYLAIDNEQLRAFLLLITLYTQFANMKAAFIKS